MESHTRLIGDLVAVSLPLFMVAASYIFFIVASLSVARSRTARLEELSDEGIWGASKALQILDHSENYLLCTQVGRFLSSVGAGLILASLMHQLPQTLLAAGLESAGTYGPLLSVLIFGLFVGTTLIVVQIAKAVSLQFPEPALCAVVVPLSVAYTLFGPVVVFVHGAVYRVLDRWNVRRSSERDLTVSADDISELVRRGSETGTIEANEMELLEGVVELSERRVRDVMTPRKDVVFVQDTASTADVVEILTRERVSRLLVVGMDLDEVKGVVLGKDLLRFVGKEVEPRMWREFIRPAFFVPVTKPVNDLLVELRSKGSHLAVALDEHGGVDGIVTLEDLVEEIVGDIIDEFDPPSERPFIMRDAAGTLTMDASVKISRLAEEFGVELPEGEYDTVAGFILAQLGHLPEAGERVINGDIEVLVQSIDNNRIGRVILRVVTPPPDEGSSEEGNESEQAEVVLA